MTAAGHSLPGAAVLRRPHGRLGRRRLPIIAVAVAAFVVAVTAIGFAVRPGSTRQCGFFCGPVVGGRLSDQSTYTNARYGFAFDHDPRWTETDRSDASVSFSGDQGPFEVRVVDGRNPQSIIDDSIGQLPGAQFQGVTKVADVRGAQIGFVPGVGAVYDANYFPSDGAEGQVVRIAVVTAGRSGLTVVADMFCAFDNRSPPYGLAAGSSFDYPLTTFRWPGQQ